MGRKRNGNHTSVAKQSQILEGLCSGLTINEVAKQTRSHWLTVRQIQWKNATTVDEHKKLLAERSEHAASDALDLLHSKLKSNADKLTPNGLVPIFGVLVDKAIALRADPTIHVEHSHEHIHAHISEDSYNDLLAKLPRRSPAIIDLTPINPD